MATATQNISIRIAVIDGDKVRRELTLTGEQGQRALAKIKEATEPASKSLVAVSVASEQMRYGMESLAGRSGSLGTSLMRLGPAGLAAAAAIGTLGLAVAGGIREFKEAEQALNQLNAALKATDFSSGVTAQEITALGEAIEGNTLFKKEAIQQAAASLTSFQNIAGETFTRALKLSADLAARLGTDVPSAADMLGKALEAPEEGLGRLARKFSDLSPTQKEVIENFVKQGEIASAQAVILEHLEAKTKGLAEAQAQGLTGATDSLSDAWDDLLESFGRTISESGAAQTSLNLLTKTVRGLQEALNPTREQKKSQLEEEIRNLQGSFGVKVDEFVLGSAPLLDAKKRELQKINDELAAEQKKADDDIKTARTAAEKNAAQQRNNLLLELQKKYLKESEDLTLTSQQKILRDAEIRKKQILALSKDENSEASKKAIAALEASTRAKLADANKQSTSKNNDAEDKRINAIEEINRRILQTKPSYDVAKQALDDWKNKLVEDLGGATEANQKYLAIIEQIYAVKLKEIYNKSQLDSEKWADGASRALGRYADEATNAAKNSERVFGNAATKIEDTLVDMVSTGEFSMKKLGDLVQSIEQDILRSFIRENITGPIAGGLSSLLGGGGAAGGSSAGGGIFGSLFSSIFHDGGVVGESSAPSRMMPAHIFATAPRFHNGLMPDEFPAILQKGETVIPKNKKVGGTNVTFNISTPNAQSFMESRGQIMAKFAGEMQRHKVRNG
ncbi:MAG: phage tail tape measure C-terminal domain-containing protein [Rickettsiales bacterium]